jgi:flagellar basal-body rod modification protein FlgD
MTAAAASSSSSSSSSSTSEVNEAMFLQLLVAQLKNQDPLNPTDGTQFVAELAQFSQLEQVMAIKTDIENYHTEAASSSSSGSSSDTSSSTSSS